MSDLQITSEPLTYRRDQPFSYAQDRIFAAVHPGVGEAHKRLEAHEREMRVELPKRRERALRAAADAGVEMRTTAPDRTPGDGGYFSPPLWVLDAFAGVPRAPRVLADLATHFDLPRGVQSVNVPRLTTGGQTAPVADDTAPTDVYVTDAAVSSPVVTVSGTGLVAQQLLDQSPAGAHVDHAFFKDLAESYDEQLEQLILYGTGTNGQFAGVATIAQVQDSYTAGTPSGTGMYTAWCEAIANVGDARKCPPTAFMVRTARWMWLACQQDGAGRPLIPPAKGHMTPMSTNAPAVKQHGLVADLVPLYANDSISTTLGASTNQDEAIVCIPEDLMLFEGTPSLSVNVDQAGSAALQPLLVLRNYVAFLAGRYPAGIATVTGTGNVIPSGF